jgi:hypothetical protein
MKNWPPVQKATISIAIPEISPEPPELVRVPLRERLEQPEEAHKQEDEPKDVGHSSEGLLRRNHQDHSGNQEQHTEYPQDPPRRSADERTEQEVLQSGEQEHESDHHTDFGNRGLVELDHDQRDHDPEDAGDKPEPPEVRRLTERISYGWAS